MITVTNVTVTTSSGKKLLENISCSAQAGRITILVGKSGAGKTTLLRTIAGLNSFDYEGSIVVDGVALSTCTSVQRASLVGFVFQDFNLFENLTVLENCVSPMIVVKKQSRSFAVTQAFGFLEQLGIALLHDAYPKNLSGGQRQRVSIARALCLGSKTLLLDEPTSALDPENTSRLVDILKGLCQQDIAILLSSQDMNFVKKIGDVVYLLEDGRLVDWFDPQTAEKSFETTGVYDFING